MSWSFGKRWIAAIITGACALAVLAGGAVAYRMLLERGPLHQEKVSLEQQDEW